MVSVRTCVAFIPMKALRGRGVAGPGSPGSGDELDE